MKRTRLALFSFAALLAVACQQPAPCHDAQAPPLAAASAAAPALPPPPSHPRMAVGAGDIKGQYAAWTGGLQAYYGSITPASELSFTPALRGIMASGAGNIVVTLNTDDDADTSKKVTLALSAATLESRYAIRKVWNSGTTATGIVGFQ